MQVAPIASGLISTQLLTITNPVSNVAAASPAGLTEAETALRVKEQQASMAAQKIAETQTTQVTQADPAATGAKTLQNHGTDNPSSKLDESANVKTAPLLDYLDKAGSDGRSLSPNSFISSGVKSFVGIVENAQSVLAGKNDAQAKQTSDASRSSTPQEAHENPGDEKGLASMDDVLDRYVSISWASFSASLATSSVAAASTSVNTLVKQQ